MRYQGDNRTGYQGQEGGNGSDDGNRDGDEDENEHEGRNRGENGSGNGDEEREPGNLRSGHRGNRGGPEDARGAATPTINMNMNIKVTSSHSRKNRCLSEILAPYGRPE